MATSITVKALGQEPGVIRRAVLADEEIAVTFHSKPLARIVPDHRWQETQSELARLRELVAQHGLADHESEKSEEVAA
jgi:antitoxin (DNA-binding transcriptional repressor) of toxin-antitoxin stability system